MNRRIKILLLVDVLEGIAGGAERQVYELTRRLSKDKFEVYLFVLHHREIPQEIKGVGCRVSGVGLKRIYSIRGILKGIKFAKFLKRENIDILMTYHFASDIWGTVFGKLAGVPVIISNRRDEGFWRRRIHKLAYRLINRWVDKIIVVSKAVERMVLEEEKLSTDKIEVVYNGVDVVKFGELVSERVNELKKSLGIKENEYIVGMVANFTWVKGHRYFIEAVKLVLEKEPNTKFLLIGDGPLRKELENSLLTTHYSLREKVLFLGTRQDIPELLQIMDICVLSSLSEGLSNVLLEYMASAKPIVATKTGGNPELIQDRVNGLLVEKANSEDLAEKIIYLLENQEERERSGLKARETIIEKFTIREMINKYESLLVSLLEKASEQRVRKLRLYIKMIISSFIYYSCIFLVMKFLRRKKPIVLCYHRIVKDFYEEKLFSHPGLLVSKKSFIEQINFLKRHYTIISMDDFVAYLNGKKRLPNFSLLITFDDGYRDNYTVAYPVLREFTIPATIFLTTEFIDFEKYPEWEKKRADGEKLMLSWQEIIEMSNDGIYFGSHSKSHPLFNREDTDDNFYREIRESKAIIEKKINKEVTTFAFPSGVVNFNVLHIIKDSGYICCFSLTNRGKRKLPSEFKRFLIERIPINEGMYIKNNGKFFVPMFACGTLNLFKTEK